MENKKPYKSILDVVGNTPIIQLNKITNNISSKIFAKLEFLNPMGSVKDRIAKYMIEKAEKNGKIKKGQLIIENSSGNTALGLALVAIQKGYKLKVMVRDRISQEKINQLKNLGVDVHLVDSTLPPESPSSYNNITPRIVKETPGCYFPDQHNNRENNEAHYLTTGPEIWEQMERKIDYFVAGMGTGGTIGGVAQYLKEQDPGIKVIAIDPEGSIFYDYFHYKKLIKPYPYLIEGLGDEFLINCADFTHIDDIYQISDRDSFLYTRKLVKEEGIMGGGSSGAALWGVLKLAKSLDKPARIVTIFPDGSSRYLSTIFNDQWMKTHKFL
ncbi:MAG: cysteine synthase family protein [Candidatus Aminicenantes bacterium]|nr:cysteine synthase family protein [Candidatus Aminicenantes bacterium]